MPWEGTCFCLKPFIDSNTSWLRRFVYSFFGCTLHTVVFCHGCCYHYPRIAYGNFMQSTVLCNFSNYFLSILSSTRHRTVLIPFSAKESIFMRSWFHETACSGVHSKQGRAGVTGSKTTGTRSQVARMKTRHAGHIFLGLDGTCAVCGSHQWRSLSNIIWFRKCCNTLLSLQVCSVVLAKFKFLKPHKMNRLFIHWGGMDPIYRCFCLAVCVCVQSFAHKNA